MWRLTIVVLVCGAIPARGADAAQISSIILARPTDHSVDVSVLPAESLQLFCEFGTSPSSYSRQSPAAIGVQDVPVIIRLTDLLPGTRYYYRLRYRPSGAGAFLSGEEHTFRTQPARGQSFRFTIEADPHPYDKKGSHTLWPIALGNQRADSADFMLDLGDTFGDDHNPSTITDGEIRQLHADCRGYFGLACHSSPLFFCVGNHEGESGYYMLQNPPNNLAISGTLWRKYYFPNPVPDGFYTGNCALEGFGVGLPENYYAWHWGDALFVVMDAYRYYTANAKPRGWDWTIGKDQYDWLKQTLESSTAKYKFIFNHHTLGETRGGASTAMLYEWGGHEADGSTWGFTANRPGWAMPIHQLMVQNRVSVYFQGHDHLFAREDVDGVVYQEVPMPSDSTYIIGMRDNGDAYGGVKLDGAGHLRVTVGPDSAQVEYVQAWLPQDENASRTNRQVAYTYVVKPAVTTALEDVLSPDRIALEQNYPNPFNPETSIEYAVPGLRLQESGASLVKLAVYDVLGREVAVPVAAEQRPGKYRVQFNGSGLSSGVYLYRLQVGSVAVTRTMVILK